MSTTPAHAPTPAPAAPVAAPADAPTATPADSTVADTQEDIAKKAAKILKAANDDVEHPEEHPEEASDHKKVVNGGYPLWIEKKEGHGLKEVGKDAAKGVWTMASTPVAFPLKMAAGVTVGVLGGAYDVARWTKNKVYNAAVHTKNAAKWFWNRDTLYIPTVVGGVASVIAWPFKKLGSGAAFLWNHKTWPFKKAWEGTKWTGRKIKGIFTKKPVTPTPVPAGTPATPPPATSAAAAHTPAATPATPVATPTPAPHHP